jgi:hypothetical protein
VSRQSIKLGDIAPAYRDQVKQQIGADAFARLSKDTRRHKFNVSPAEERTVDGIVFDSKVEARIFCALRQQLDTKAIQLQPQFMLQERFRDSTGKMTRAIIYCADFLIGPLRSEIDAPLHPGHVVVDVKGFVTKEFAIKKKMFQARYAARLYTPKNLTDVAEIVAACKNYGNTRNQKRT